MQNAMRISVVKQTPQATKRKNPVDEKELKAKLVEMDQAIKSKQADVEDTQLELKHLREKRKAFANRNCPHTKKYQRSVMGREIDTYCELCNEFLY
jgi:hypothetical protein